MSTIGYNVNLSAIDNLAISDAQISNGAMHLLMTTGNDAIQQIAEWKQKLGADRIVWRKYSKLEGNWSAYPSNDEIVKDWLSEGHLDIIRDDPSNEPSLNKNDMHTNQAFVARSVDLLHIAGSQGIKVAIGAFSVGMPHESMISGGVYDDLIKAVVQGGHYISVHEYCPGIPGAGDVFPYNELLNPETVVSKMKVDSWAVEAAYWLLRRSDRFVVRARELGLSDPQIIVTEAFIDLIPDANDVLNQLRDEYGIENYMKDLRGVLSWRKYYLAAFPNMAYSQVVEHLTKYIALKIYNEDFHKGVCLYALNTLWDEPEGHNFLNDILDNFRRFSIPAINQLIDEIPDGIPMPPEPPQVIQLPSPDMVLEFALHHIQSMKSS